MIAIINGLVKTMAGPDIEDGIILVNDGKIAAIGSKNDVLIPNGTEVIDAKRCLTTPGLVDAHTHIGIDEEGVGWEGDDYNEDSDVSTPHVRAVDGINPRDIAFREAVNGGITAVQVLPGSSNVIGGLTVCLKLKPGNVLKEMIIKDPAGLKVALGENPKKTQGKGERHPKTRMGIAAVLREEFIKAKNYLAQEEIKRTRDLRMEAMGMVLKREIPLRAHAHQARDIETIIRIAQEFNLDLTIDHATEGHLISDYLSEAGVMLAIGPSISSRGKVELRDKSSEIYKILAKAQVPFAIITDHPIMPLNYLTVSAGLAVSAGLYEEEAWRAITINPAKILRLHDRIGSLETGKDADIVIWQSNPLKGYAKVSMTMIDGKIIYRS